MANVKAIVTTTLLVIIAIVLVFEIVGNMSDTMTDAADNISTAQNNLTGSTQQLPLSSLFSSSGITYIVVMAMILLGVIGLAMSLKKS